jgi:hypothetical protein
MKRVVVLSLVLAFVWGTAFVFTGGGSDEKAAESGKTVVKPGNRPADTLPGDIAMHQEWVKQFNRKYPDVIIQPAYYFTSTRWIRLFPWRKRARP